MDYIHIHDTDNMSERGIWAGHLRESLQYTFLELHFHVHIDIVLVTFGKGATSPSNRYDLVYVPLYYIKTQPRFCQGSRVEPSLRAKSCKLADQQICDCLTGLGTSRQKEEEKTVIHHHHHHHHPLIT